MEHFLLTRHLDPHYRVRIVEQTYEYFTAFEPPTEFRAQVNISYIGPSEDEQFEESGECEDDEKEL